MLHVFYRLLFACELSPILIYFWWKQLTHNLQSYIKADSHYDWKSVVKSEFGLGRNVDVGKVVCELTERAEALALLDILAMSSCESRVIVHEILEWFPFRFIVWGLFVQGEKLGILPSFFVTQNFLDFYY